MVGVTMYSLCILTGDPLWDLGSHVSHPSILLGSEAATWLYVPHLSLLSFPPSPHSHYPGLLHQVLGVSGTSGCAQDTYITSVQGPCSCELQWVCGWGWAIGEQFQINKDNNLQAQGTLVGTQITCVRQSNIGRAGFSLALDVRTKNWPDLLQGVGVKPPWRGWSLPSKFWRTTGKSPAALSNHGFNTQFVTSGASLAQLQKYFPEKDLHDYCLFLLQWKPWASTKDID